MYNGIPKLDYWFPFDVMPPCWGNVHKTISSRAVVSGVCFPPKWPPNLCHLNKSQGIDCKPRTVASNFGQFLDQLYTGIKFTPQSTQCMYSILHTSSSFHTRNSTVSSLMSLGSDLTANSANVRL